MQHCFSLFAKYKYSKSRRLIHGKQLKRTHFFHCHQADKSHAKLCPDYSTDRDSSYILLIGFGTADKGSHLLNASARRKRIFSWRTLELATFCLWCFCGFQWIDGLDRKPEKANAEKKSPLDSFCQRRISRYHLCTDVVVVVVAALAFDSFQWLLLVAVVFFCCCMAWWWLRSLLLL